MLLELVFKKTIALAALCLIASPVLAQETAKVSTAQTATASATLSAEGELIGNILTTKANQITKVPNAQVSLVSQGKVIDSVTADASGNFSFANVHPGPYQIVGAAAGLVGSQAFDVAPFAEAQGVAPGQVMLTQSAPEVMYDSYSSAPVQSLSTGCSTCNTCNTCSTCAGGGSGIGGRLGGGIGRGFGGGIGSGIGGRGLLGRGILSGPRGLLVAGGIAGGVVAIAVDDDENDASPDF